MSWGQAEERRARGILAGFELVRGDRRSLEWAVLKEGRRYTEGP